MYFLIILDLPELKSMKIGNQSFYMLNELKITGSNNIYDNWLDLPSLCSIEIGEQSFYFTKNVSITSK